MAKTGVVLFASFVLCAIVLFAIFPRAGVLAAIAVALPIPIIIWSVAVSARTRLSNDALVPDEDLAASFGKEYYAKMRAGWVVPTSVRVVKSLQLGALSLPLRAQAVPKVFRWHFNDWWVVGWFAYAIVAFVALPSLRGDGHGIGYVIAAFGMLRLFELLAYHVELAFFTLMTRANLVANATRTALLTLVNYGEVVVWFATFYLLLMFSGDLVVEGPAPVVVLNESFVEMVANSGSGVHLVSATAWTFSLVHKVIGLFMTSVVLSRVIALLALPEPLPGKVPGVPDDPKPESDAPRT